MPPPITSMRIDHLCAKLAAEHRPLASAASSLSNQSAAGRSLADDNSGSLRVRPESAVNDKQS
jgi:hypothetical protein